MIKNLFVLLVLISLTSCKGKLDKLLMSNDVAMKEQKAQEFFENCDYASASPLFKDLIQSFSTSAKVEKVYFYFAYCDYKLEDYMLAAYEFKKILEKFPRGKYAERAQFLIADSYFKSTPKYNLDQEYNGQAVEEFQIFLEKYPESEKRQDANHKIDLLIEKREKKHFENAKLFYNTREYKAAIQSFQFVLNDFPDTKRDEELHFLMVESAYLYAERSIEHKKSERYSEVNEYATRYLKKYDNPEEAVHSDEVLSYQLRAKKKALDLQYSLPIYYFKKKRYDEAITLWRNLITKSHVENKKVVAEKLLEAYYEKGLNVKKTLKIGVIDEFLSEYLLLAGKLEQEKVDKWKSKNEYFTKLQRELPNKLPYEFLASGEYDNAVEYFEYLIDTADLSKSYNDKMFYNFLLSKQKLAAKQREVPAKLQWDEITKLTSKHVGWKEGKFAGRMETLLKVVNDEMGLYPVILISNPLKRKNYTLALKRAKAEIDGGNKVENQQEVIYLLLLSSVKKARSVKKYERLPQYKNAKLDYEAYAGLLKDAKLIEKAVKIEQKINTGITKYQNK
jgi:outer membrane protein assembly factor BamD